MDAEQNDSPADPTTRILHDGAEPELGLPVGDPLELTSFYVSRGAPSQGQRSYARHTNRSWEALESALGRLERAEALVFASGMAATLNLMLALADLVAAGRRPRFVLPSDGYHGVRVLADMLLARGIEHTAVDQQDLAAVEQVLASGESAGTAPILWTETPTNPFLRVLDLRALAELARAHGAPLVCDNTTATAALQRPLECGATATLTSLSKAGSGHSDVLLGAVATRDTALLERLTLWRTHGGAIAGPFEAWLALRGLKTLPVRIERQSRSALAIASWLAAHPAVARVHYPGIEAATLELAGRQMPAGFGPLLSFELAGDRSAQRADSIIAKSRLIQHGTSFGGVESSWERRARWPAEHAPPDLIRLSVGLEDPAELRRDLELALRY